MIVALIKLWWSVPLSLWLLLLVAGWYALQYHLNKSIVPVRGKVIVVTGCDSGFGASLAKRLDKAGALVIANCLTAKGAADLKAACSERLTTHVFDVSDENAVADAASKISQTHAGGVYAVVNNAGVFGGYSVDLTRIATFRKVMDVNFFGTLHVTKALLPLLKQSSGRLVNISGITGRIAPPRMGAYAASQYAIEALSDALRLELAPWKVKVSVIEPGFCKTNMVRNMKVEIQSEIDNADDKLVEEYGDSYFKQGRAVQQQFVENTAEPEVVVEAIERCLESAYPRTRYVVGDPKVSVFVLLGTVCGGVRDFVMQLLAAAPTPAALAKSKSA